MSYVSSIVPMVNDMLTQVASIPYQWNGDKAYPSVLFQKVAVYNKQPERELEDKNNNYAFDKPACFLEFRFENPIALVGGSTLYDLVLICHLVDRQEDAGDGTLDQNLEVLAYRDLLVNYMSNYQATFCNPLYKCGEEMDKDHSNVYIYKIMFKCGFTDISGSFTQNKTDVGGNAMTATLTETIIPN